MTRYQYTFKNGNPVIDLTEDEYDDAVPATAPSSPAANLLYPTPSLSPEVASSAIGVSQNTKQPVKSLLQRGSIENPSRTIDPVIKTKVALALLVEGREKLNREKLSQEVSYHHCQIRTS